MSYRKCHTYYSAMSAGASQHALAEETTPEVTKKLFDLNTVAPINLTQALLLQLFPPSPQPDSANFHTTQHQQSKPPSTASQQASTANPSGFGSQSRQNAVGAQGTCHIVVVGSMAGKVPAPGQAVYSACKTALVGYFSSLQSELAARYASASFTLVSNIIIVMLKTRASQG